MNRLDIYNITITTFLILFLIGCKRNETKYFEGVITYKITYSTNDDRPSYGDTMKVYYSNGNLLKEYNGKDVRGLKKELFLGATNQYFMQIGSSDTLFSYDISTNNLVSLVDTKKTKSNVNILGYNCDKIELIQLGHAGNNNFYIYGGYEYSRKALRINPIYFKNWKFANFNSFTDEAGCYYLKLTSSHQDYSKKDLITRTYEAVNIQEKQIDPQMFYFDSLKVKIFKIK